MRATRLPLAAWPIHISKSSLLPKFAGVDRHQADPGCRAMPPAILHQIECVAVVNLSFACNRFRQPLRGALAGTREQAYGKANGTDRPAQMAGVPPHIFRTCVHISESAISCRIQ